MVVIVNLSLYTICFLRSNCRVVLVNNFQKSISFQSIKEKSEQEAKEKKFSFEAANKSDNRRLNRYRDVNPYDHSRIVLHRGDVDYINANLVTVIDLLDVIEVIRLILLFL